LTLSRVGSRPRRVPLTRRISMSTQIYSAWQSFIIPCGFLPITSSEGVVPTFYFAQQHRGSEQGIQKTEFPGISLQSTPQSTLFPFGRFQPTVSPHNACPAASHVYSSHKIGMTTSLKSSHLLIPTAAVNQPSAATYQDRSGVFIEPTPPTTKIHNSSLGARRQLVFNSESTSAVLSI
jgi:hypothetical protein